MVVLPECVVIGRTLCWSHGVVGVRSRKVITARAGDNTPPAVVSALSATTSNAASGSERLGCEPSVHASSAAELANHVEYSLLVKHHPLDPTVSRGPSTNWT